MFRRAAAAAVQRHQDRRQPAADRRRSRLPGNYVANGAKIAADEINAKGGVLGKKIELVIEDNKSNPTEAAAVAEKLIIARQGPGA